MDRAGELRIRKQQQAQETREAKKAARDGERKRELTESFGEEAAAIFLGADEHAEQSWKDAEQEFEKQQ